MLPQFIAYMVTEPADGGADTRAIWRPVGSVWKHRNGNGFDLVIYPQLSVSGRIVIAERKERTGDAPTDRPA
jgi:hypothetical protein